MPHGNSVTCIVSPDEEYQHQLQHHHQQQQQQLLIFGQAENAPAPTADYGIHFSQFSVSGMNNGSNGGGGGEFALQQYYNPNYNVHMEDGYRYDSNNTTSTELPPLPEDITSSGNYFNEHGDHQFPTTAISDQMGYSSNSNSLLNEMIMPMDTFGMSCGEVLGGGSTITTTSSTTTSAGSYNYFGFNDWLQPQQQSLECNSNMQDNSNNTTLNYWFS
ncbi:hypothetical protein K7X08_001359 [Anisodus acutangulus]|uniref:Uncharacterized protein n=1 Tax=Anisodus acutangulus TaxID=402998 RepID=A0A9Q1MNK0_9SOLA|nr:hypothetical protein K7X08_001359 [Anisodus acutangulus]